MHEISCTSDINTAVPSASSPATAGPEDCACAPTTALQIELIVGLDRHETHVLVIDRLGDSLYAKSLISQVYDLLARHTLYSSIII